MLLNKSQMHKDTQHSLKKGLRENGFHYRDHEKLSKRFLKTIIWEQAQVQCIQQTLKICNQWPQNYKMQGNINVKNV